MYLRVLLYSIHVKTKVVELFLLQKSEATDRNYIKQQQKQRETERLNKQIETAIQPN
jgi:hypothetical protein